MAIEACLLVILMSTLYLTSMIGVSDATLCDYTPVVNVTITPLLDCVDEMPPTSTTTKASERKKYIYTFSLLRSCSLSGCGRSISPSREPTPPNLPSPPRPSDTSTGASSTPSSSPATSSTTRWSPPSPRQSEETTAGWDCSSSYPGQGWWLSWPLSSSHTDQGEVSTLNQRLTSYCFRPGPRPTSGGRHHPWLVKLGLVEDDNPEPRDNYGFDMETTTDKGKSTTD